MKEKVVYEKKANEIVKVTLECGRNMSTQSNYSQDDCGWGENATSNQTQATCC